MLKAEDEEKDKKENSKEGDEPKTEEVDDEGTFPSHKAFAGGFAVGLITSWLTIALCEAGLPADLKYNLRYYSFPIVMAINLRVGQKVWRQEKGKQILGSFLLPDFMKSIHSSAIQICYLSFSPAL